mgnify:FL=1
MRKSILIVLALALAATTACARGDREDAEDSGASERQEGTAINAERSSEFIAEVDGVGIRRESYEQAVQNTLRSFQQQGRAVPEEDLETFRSEILDQLIAEEILYQTGVDRGYEPTEQSIDTQFEQMRGRFETEEEWQQALDAQGTTEEQLREQLVRNTVLEQVITDVTADVEPATDEEVQVVYDENPQFFETGSQVEARHILLSTQGLEDEDAVAAKRAEAEAVRDELLAGADFATLAEERSEGPSAAQGGSLGTFGRGQMVAPFEEAAFALAEGEVSGIVQTQFGFHIIQVTDIIEGGFTPIEQVSANIRQFLGQQRQADALAAFVDEAREEADVTVYN